MQNKLLPKVKKFPLSSGVYLFIGKNSKVLYVGRAVNLRRRVLNYFQKNLDNNLDLRISEMVGLAKDVKIKKTKNLLEAVILEANLIKKYWPKYNVKEKDDRSFIYIVIPKKDWAYPFLIRGKELSKYQPKNAEIFGPYQSFSLAKNILLILRKIFPYSSCDICRTGKTSSQRGSASERAWFSREARKSERAAPVSELAGRANGSENLSFQSYCKPCFYYQIGLCPGKCIGAISQKDYQKNINNLKKILRKTQPEKLDFLSKINDSVLIVKEDGFKPARKMRIEGYDISHFSGKETVGAMAVLTDGEPDKSQYRKFIIKKSGNNDLFALREMVLRRFGHKEWPMPNFILIDGGKPQIDFISKEFQRLNINIPLVGLSKYAGDKLIFQKGVKKQIKDLIESSKGDLLKLRDEAHRFAITFSRARRRQF